MRECVNGLTDLMVDGLGVEDQLNGPLLDLDLPPLDCWLWVHIKGLAYA